MAGEDSVIGGRNLSYWIWRSGKSDRVGGFILTYTSLANTYLEGNNALSR